ncbi:MAG: hypothetical protein ACAI44_24700 [Candidatus Sericytochromatia bacterium]
MIIKTQSWALKLMAGALLLAACTGPVLPITPETLSGCWQGEIPFVATAKVQIAKAVLPNTYTVNGEAKAGSNTYPISNVTVEYDTTTGELKPSNLPGQAQNVPLKLKVDGAEIKATASGTPFSINLKRCTGTPAPTGN